MDVPTDKEVWQLAIMLIEKHGADATRFAEEQAQQALDDDDVIGHGAWVTVAEAVKELLRGPHGGGEVN
jgi:triphosphoribosyl-dephospho-CoA synthetase